MQITLSAFTAIITANSFNPSVFRESWLASHGFLTEADLQPGFVFSDQVTHVQSTRFGLLIVPQQLQFVPNERLSGRQLVPDVLGRLVRELPHTPFTAAGINFVWHLHADNESLARLTRRLFGRTDGPLAQEFDAPDAHFGAYMSKDVGGARLRLDFKPMNIPTGSGSDSPQTKEVIECAFNFHKEVDGPRSVDSIVEHLARWSEFDLLAERLSNLVGNAQ